MACSQARTATSEALSLDIEPSACSNGLRWAAIHAARQVSRRAASMSAARSASGNEMPWFSMIGWPKASRSVGVVAGELERRAGDPDRLRGDHRTRALEGAERGGAAALHRGRGAALLGGGAGGGVPCSASRPFAIRSASRSSPPSSWSAGHAAVLEDDLAGV